VDYYHVVDYFAKLLRGNPTQCAEAERALVSNRGKSVDRYLREITKSPVDEEIKLAAKDILSKRKER